MRWSISIPQLDTDGFDGPGLKAYLARAEELGFEAGWTLEQAIGPTPLIAPLEILAYAAACTERLRLGVGVLVSSLHDPLQLASSITAVDRLSHGRLDVGVAPGGGFRKFAAFGVDPETFVARFTEGLELMKAAWSDEPASGSRAGSGRSTTSRWRPSRCSARTRRSGSGPPRRRRWPARSATATPSWAPARRRPRRSRSR